jgi:hypothetical protein
MVLIMRTAWAYGMMVGTCYVYGRLAYICIEMNRNERGKMKSLMMCPALVLILYWGV